MKTKNLFLIIILLFVSFSSDVPNIFSDESHFYWVNPLYEDILSDTPSSENSRQNTGTVQCFSYEELINALKEKFEQRATEFKIHLKYDFSFDDAKRISEQACNEVIADNDYLRYHISSWKIGFKGNDGNVDIDYTMRYLTTYEQEQKVSQRVTEVLDEIITQEMNDEEKEKEIHDWIILNVRYDTSSEYHAAYDALFRGTAVCQGYASLAYKMLRQVGIETRIIKGTTSDGGGHGWNLVNLCGNWYHLDITFDDPLPDVPGRVLYTYFNKSDDEMRAEHVWDEDEEEYPKAPITYEEGICAGQTPEQTLNIMPDSCNFGMIDIGTSSESQRITVSNTGETAVELGMLSITGADAFEFSIENDTCSAHMIIPSDICTIDLIFSPESEGVKNAALEIPSDTLENLSVSLNGVGADPNMDSGWMNISGTVQYDQKPLCAMVLANGQYMFSCGESEGTYEFKAPLDSEGKITLFAFCDGVAPFKQTLYPSDAAKFNIQMQDVPQDSEGINMEASLTPGKSGKMRIRGTVRHKGMPLCAMILANGQHMFSCDKNNGIYDLDVPLDANNQITLFGFCDGFLPFKQVLNME